MYGIPNMKLPKEIVARRVGLMKAEGVELLPAYRGRRLVARGLRRGAPLRRRAARPAAGGARRETQTAWRWPWTTSAEATRALLEGRAPSLTAQGKDVLVVGGGDTGNDCVATCLRQGCEIRCAAGNAARPARAARSKANPWPEWPRVLRTDYGQLEAIAAQGGDPRLFETTVERVLADENGNIRAVEAVRVARGTDGRLRTPSRARAARCPVSCLLIAAGFVGCEQETRRALPPFPQRPPPSRHSRRHAYSSPPASSSPVICAAVQSLVVRALADGRAAAMEAHRYLGGEARCGI